MTKRCLCPVAVCFVFGLIYSLKDIKWILVPLGILSIYIFLRLINYHMVRRALIIVGLLFATFLVGVLQGYKAENQRDKCQTIVNEGDSVIIQGRLYKKETKNDRYYLYLDKGRIKTKDASVDCADILVMSENLDYHLGNTLVVEGIYREFEEARNEGNYDEKEYYYNKGIEIKIDNVKSVYEYGNKNTIREFLYRIKEKMKNVMRIYLGDSYFPMLSAVVLGDKTDISSEEKELYKNAGISHILSVSGLHISLLCMGFFGFLKKIKCPRAIAFVLSIFFGVTYCIFTGESVSTIRAVGMFIISLIAMQLGEAYDMLSALSLLLIIILLNSPYVLFSSGLLLSFGAVLGICLTGKEFGDFYNSFTKRRDFLRSHKRHIEKKKQNIITTKIQKYLDGFVLLVISNIAILITTFPIVLWFYYEIPTLSLIVNILIIPLMGLLLGIGFIGSMLGTLYLPLGIALVPSKLIIEFYRMVSIFVDKIPFSSIIIGQPKLHGIIIYYLLLFSLLKLLNYIKTYGLKAEYEGAHIIKEDLADFKKISLIFYASVAIVIFLSLFLLSSFVDKTPAVKMLDVGQGDGIFIRTEEKNIFVDGGSSSIKEVGKYRMIPFLKCVGAGKIDYWFISHPDEDHISGLLEVLESDINVEKILVSKYISTNEHFEKISVLCKEKGIDIYYMTPDDYLELKDAKFSCVYPSHKKDSVNENSMVLFYETDDAELLLTGDIGKSEEKEFVSKLPAKTKKTRILKVAHHGSKNSSDEKFIETYSPDIAIISAGKNNSYGHPHKETLDTLEKLETSVFRTDMEGEIILKNNKP